MCSIGFISGDTAGQGSTLTLFLFRNCRHILATWGIALSCINIAGPCLWRKGTASDCRIWLMWPWALRLRCTTMKFVFLLTIMPPHTITLPPPNRSLSMRHLSAKRSPLLLKTRIRPSWWLKLNLDSSENRTRAHCCRPQRKCRCAHCKRAARWRAVSTCPT